MAALRPYVSLCVTHYYHSVKDKKYQLCLLSPPGGLQQSILLADKLIVSAILIQVDIYDARGVNTGHILHKTSHITQKTLPVH